MSARHVLFSILACAGLLACSGCASPAGNTTNNAGAISPTANASANAGQKSSVTGPVWYLHRHAEPKEGAFTILLPEGWRLEGGVLRLNPASGPMNSVGAKIDCAEKRDAAGTVMMHWLPNISYKDPRLLPGFQVGSNYMGMMVLPVMDAQTFLAQFVFPRQRPGAQRVQVVERKPLTQLAQQYQQKAMPGLPERFDATVLTVTYDEGGIHYKEQMAAVIEDVEGSTGWWTNHDTLMVRAPAAEFDQFRPLFAAIQNSLRGNPQWVAGENRGAAQRAHNALETQRYLEQQRHQIVENRREANAEKRYEHWLDISGHEDYVNPHTGKVEVDTNEWKNRWESANGDVVLCNDPNYDPNFDPRAAHTDYKRSGVRAR
jgi:hypothetical protein